MFKSILPSIVIAASASFATAAVYDLYGEDGKKLCASQAPRVTESSPTSNFTKCTHQLANGAILTWDRNVQHQKDIAAGLVPK